MSTIFIHRPEFLRLSVDGYRKSHKSRRIAASWTMTMDSNNSSQTRRKEEPPLRNHSTPPLAPQSESLVTNDLHFDRLQLPDQDLICRRRLEFGHFVAREAMLDEEFWTAAWLRAESHWEDRPHERYVDNHKRKFADQEFNAIKRRCRGQHGQTCTCIVAVKKERRNIKRTVLKSVVGTLDLSIRYFLLGETFPGERLRGPLFCHKTGQNRYGYIANLCVAKSARRQGIASNMMHFAIHSAKSSGVELVYVHVHKKNIVARELYQKLGFEVILLASSQFEEQTYLLCLKT